MNSIFKNFTKEIKFKTTPNFEHMNIKKAQLLEKDIFELVFTNFTIIPFKDMEKFMIALNNNFKYKTKLKLEVEKIILDKDEILQYINWIIKLYLEEPFLANIVINSQINIENFKIIFLIDSPFYFSKFNTIKKQCIKIMQKLGFKDLSLEIQQKTEIKNLLKNEAEDNLQKAKIAIKNSSFSTPKNKVNKNDFQNKILIRDLYNSNFVPNIVDIEGEVFDIEHKETKNDFLITRLSITDYKDAIYVKIFAKTNEDKERNKMLKKGDFLHIKGNFQIDMYTKEPTIISKKIFKEKKPYETRKDTANNKRVELSTRTKMSTMDGITSASSYLERAQQWNHKAITIIDTDSLQSFPELYNASKNMKVKPIFGVSLNTINENSKAMYNFQDKNKDKNLEKDTYIVLDIETTGLSPIFDEIIEFGAIKIENNQIVDKKQFFIKPSHKISDFTKTFTGISDEDLENAKPEAEAIQDISTYLKNYTAIAHNAKFDFTFINEKLKKYGYDTLNITIIDSMVVSRIIFPESKRFRLENVANKLDVHYDSNVAHRADYDANVLAKIWMKIIDELKKENIKIQQDLYNYKNEKLYEKAFAKEVSILVKNQKGLKELFKIISTSLTTNYFNGTKIFLETLLKNKKNILLGSGALNSRLVNLMLFGSKEQIIKEISYYDYIEVQPTQNFSHIINRGFKLKNLEKIIAFVIKEAKKQNKIVVATGDVRYLDEKDKIHHNIYINAKGLGGVRHYLYKFNEQNPIYPTQKLLTTNEMKDKFKFLEDKNLIEEIVVNNTNKIADMIEQVQIIKDNLSTPKFNNADKLLKELSYKNAKKIYGKKLPKIVENRLEKELKPIIKYGFSVIYWISHLLVAKSLEDGYLVGSRGSVGSSLIATMSKITEVNPLVPHYICPNCKYSKFFENSKLNSGYDLPNEICPNCQKDLQKEGQKILFETFLGFEANKVPDIDLNFSGKYQLKIHDEVKKLFGSKHSFRAGTISTVAERTAFGYVKAWMEDNNKKLSKAFIEYLVKGLIGTKRTTGQHPGGIIVIPKEFDVEDFTPINFPANDKKSSWKTTHFDFHAIHDNVLKLDLLGHDDPTAIRQLEKLTGINAKQISMSDKKIISLFSSTKALKITPEDINGEQTGAMGIPEFGTKFVRGMLKNAKVTCFGDLISISGLSHGTDVWTKNAELLVKNNGLKLNELISCRDDIMVDLVDKGLKPIIAFEIMEKVRKGISISNEQETILKSHNVENWYINSLKQIKYMFPKAHATAYVIMAWRVAYFKLYYPLAYYATYFSTRADVSDIKTIITGKWKVVEILKNLNLRQFVRGEHALSNKEQNLIPILEIVNEAMARGVKFLNISLEKSQAQNWIIDKKQNAIIPPFSAIDGLGDSISNSIIIARDKGPFISKEDLVKRTSINKTILNKLETFGVLDKMEESDQISLDLEF